MTRIIPDINARSLRHGFAVGESDKSEQALVSNLQATIEVRVMPIEVESE